MPRKPVPAGINLHHLLGWEERAVTTMRKLSLTVQGRRVGVPERIAPTGLWENIAVMSRKVAAVARAVLS